MTTKQGRTTVELSTEVYRAIEALAAERGQPIAALADQAIREWLESKEAEEDLQAMAEAEAEGGQPVPWDRVKAELSARDNPTHLGPYPRTLQSRGAPPGHEATEGQGWCLPSRSGEYRVLFTDDPETRQLVVFRVRHRKDAYRNL